VTAEEWDNCADPELMLSDISSYGSVRKARLLLVACGRSLTESLPLTPELRATHLNILKVLEGQADEVSPDNWSSGLCSDWDYVHAQPLEESDHLYELYLMATCTGLSGGLLCASYAVPNEERSLETKRQATLLREIFGNPYRSTPFDPLWRTSDSVAIAKTVYHSRDFSAMPILADALQDAGCDCDAILTHCRDVAAHHVPGCWVVDLVLDQK
jgi:hypothetical protein